MAVWQVDPKAFEAFDRKIVAEQQRPTTQSALQLARSLVPMQKLDQALNSDQPAAMVGFGAQFYQAAGGGTLPKLIWVGGGMRGAFDEPGPLFESLEKNLGVRPVEVKPKEPAAAAPNPNMLAVSVLALVLLFNLTVIMIKIR